jgi:pimeloyl-ACP methyl ester carboxylesterase
VLLICAVLYLLAFAVVGIFQRRLIYFPPVFASQQVDEMARSEKVERWLGPGGVAIGWKRLSPKQPAEGEVLITHGNAGCAFQCGHYADVIQEVAPLDVYIVEYPGYADRPGTPNERSLEAAVEEAFQSLPANGPLYLVGESLGTGVAAWLAGRHPERVAGVIMLAGYNSLADVAQTHMPWLPARLLLRDRFPAEDYLRTYHGPLAVLAASGDTVIPAKFARRLHNQYVGPKKFWEFPGGDHGTVMLLPAKVWTEIITFCRTNAPSPSGHPCNNLWLGLRLSRLQAGAPGRGFAASP